MTEIVYDIYIFSTSPNLCNRTTLLNTLMFKIVKNDETAWLAKYNGNNLTRHVSYG